MDDEFPEIIKIPIPEMSEWSCYLFGSTPNSLGITWKPLKNKEPNWFWRWMQYIFFGNLWIKESRDKEHKL